MTAAPFQTHIDAFLLAVASSTDNFMVGITAGLASPKLSHFLRVNLVVALCNSSGTLLATYGGDTLKQLPELALMRLAQDASASSSPETYVIIFSIESLLAGLAFAYLAWKEIREEGDLDDDEDDKTKNKTGNLSYSLALPMTLNNLAGGVAGGVLGLSVFQATFYAFLVSFGSMAIGYALAARLLMMQQNNSNNSQEKKKKPSIQWGKYVAVLIYVLLSLQSFSEV